MNKERRKEIDRIVARIGDELTPLLDSIRYEIETVRDEEQEYFDNMPESLQGGDKGDTAQTAIDSLDEAVSEIEGWDIDIICNALGAAQE